MLLQGTHYLPCKLILLLLYKWWKWNRKLSRKTLCMLLENRARNRILSHFFADIKHTSWVLTLFLRGKFPFPVPRIEYNKVALKSVLTLLKVLCPLTTYFHPLPVGRQTLKAITVQHSPPLPRARPGHPVSGKLQETAKLRAHIVQDVASGRVTWFQAS